MNIKTTALRVAEQFTNPDVFFVFGAGASYADGAPLQADILPIIMSDELPDIRKSKTGQSVTEFIEDNFAWDERAQIFPTLETIFGFLDYFISQDEHLSAKYPNARIRTIKEGLIKLIHYVISVKSNGQGRTYRAFWESICRYKPAISILTLNYDTLLEDAFSMINAGRCSINYCLHFLNHDLAGKRQKKYPRSKPNAIKILKGHGSLNWKYCRCCKQVLLTPRDSRVDLLEEHNIQGPGSLSKYFCPLDSSEFETLIIPPSHIKKISHPVISQILNEAIREIRACQRVVFVGYSFPDADVHFKALFKKSLSYGQQVIVINNSKSKTLKYNYLALTDNVQFIKLSFADFLASESLVKDILTGTGSVRDRQT